MAVLITGGAGFIGANLARALRTGAPMSGRPVPGLEPVDEVVVLDDLSTGDAANLAGVDVELVQGSILDRDLLGALAARADSVVHLAARPSVPRSIADPVASHEANATGTLYVLEAARAAGNVPVVLASSSSVYGDTPVLPKHEGLPPRPRSPYAASKLATESYAIAYHHSYGLPVLALRFFNVFGPLQAAGHAYAAVVPAFVDAALAGRPLPLHGDGTQSRDFTFVDTVVAVLAAAALGPVSHDEPVNLAFGTRTDLNALIAELGAVLGHDLAVERQPSRAGDVAHSQAEHSVLDGLFPDVEPVDLRTGLEATVAWFRTLAPAVGVEDA